MRRRLALFLIFALAAGQAGAQSSANPNATLGLRGAQSPTAAAAGAAKSQAPAPVEAPPAPSLAPPPPLMSRLPPGPDQPLCRTTCARAYYFCLSVGDAAEDCGGTWAQCAAKCNRSPS